MGTKILNSRWFYVVLSILLAFLLWVYVGNDPNSCLLYTSPSPRDS